MGQRSTRVQAFTDSEQVHDLHHRDPSPSNHLPHRPDEEKPEGERDQRPISRLKRKMKKKMKKAPGDFNFFKCLSFRRKNTSSDQDEIMKDQETETPRRSTDDENPPQSISRSGEVIDLREPPVDDPEVLPAAELQTPVLDAPVRLTAGETSPLRHRSFLWSSSSSRARLALSASLSLIEADPDPDPDPGDVKHSSSLSE